MYLLNYHSSLRERQDISVDSHRLYIVIPVDVSFVLLILRGMSLGEESCAMGLTLFPGRFQLGAELEVPGLKWCPMLLYLSQSKTFNFDP